MFNNLMSFWKGAVISTINCSAGFHGCLRPEVEESKNSTKQTKKADIHILRKRCSPFNDKTLLSVILQRLSNS